ncbi:hypothetical protein HDZ31DRAFT_83022 [Schizophyllum fasciatum]
MHALGVAEGLTSTTDHEPQYARIEGQSRRAGGRVHSFLSSRVHLYSESVVLIGRVCSRWRGVTHGCPALWTLVDVGYPGKQALAILRRCLAYSAGLPLVLRISKSITPNLNASSIDSRFMSLVAAHARRWAEISIDLSGSHDVLQPLIDLPPGSFHLLQRAHVSFYRLDRAAVSPDALLWDAILTSPRMQSAELLKVQYTLSGLASAPLPRFTRLGLHSAEPEMVAHVIEACPMLDTLYVSIFPPVMGDARPLPIHRPVDLQHLRVLMLCGNTDWNPLLENLILPNLDRLDMSRMSVHRNAVEQMLERSAARPRMLAIHWPTVGQARDIVALLVTSALQNLKVLRYKRCCLDLGWEGDLELKPFVPAGISYTTDSGEAEMAYESLQHKPR